EAAGPEDATEAGGAADAEGDTAEKPADDAAAEEKDAEAAPAGSTEVNGSPFAPDAEGLLVPAGETITAIGDSLVVTSADGLTYRFPGINYVAKSNRQWRDAPPIIEQALAEGSVRDNVVLHLGTNAGVDEQGLRDALDAFGPER